MRRLVAGVILLTFWRPFAAASDERLPIAPVIQKTPVWCWAAVSEMVLDHFGLPNANPAGNYQCGIVGAAAYMSNNLACYQNCGNCVVSAGNAQNLMAVIENYSEIAGQYLGWNLSDVNTLYTPDALSESDIVDAIDDGSPVIAGISPNRVFSMNGATSDHVVLIIGYKNDGEELIVNDPYPYKSTDDPYLRVGATKVRKGRYNIEYDSFVADLKWGESILTEEQ